MYDNMLNTLNREKRRIEDMIQNYQNQPQPVNNFINTNQTNQYQNMYEMKKLNENDDVENIFIDKDSIFIGVDRMQIKKLDGTIEKYNIIKTFPIDPKDKQIEELNKKVQELERRLNNEPTKFNDTNGEINKSNGNVNEYVESKPKTNGKPISK